MSESIQSNQVVRFEITIGGTVFTQDEAKGFQRMVIEDHVDMIGMAQVTVGMEADWSFDIGAAVEVKVGGNDRKVFVGQITGLRHHWSKGAVGLTIIAMDPLVMLASSRRTKVFEESTDSDAASSTISDGGATAGNVDSTSAKHQYIFQRNESDLNFLKRLASRNGYLVMANEGKIDFQAAQTSGSAIEVPTDKIVSLDYTMTDVNVPKSLLVYGWDYATKEVVKYEAKSVDGIGGGATAVSEAKTWQAGSYISDVLVTSQAGAQAMAEGELNRLARSFIRGRIVVEGDGAFYAGVGIKLTGLRPGFNAEGFVVSARHIIEAKGGFTTEVSFVGNTKPA